MPGDVLGLKQAYSTAMGRYTGFERLVTPQGGAVVYRTIECGRWLSVAVHCVPTSPYLLHHTGYTWPKRLTMFRSKLIHALAQVLLGTSTYNALKGRHDQYSDFSSLSPLLLLRQATAPGCSCVSPYCIALEGL